MLCDVGVRFPHIKGLHYSALGFQNEKYFEVKNELEFGFAMLQCDEIFAEMLR